MVIKKLLDTTEELAVRIELVDEDSINKLLELRDEVISLLQSNIEGPSPSEKDLLLKILEYEELILQRMHILKAEAADALEKIQSSRMQKSVYENNYDHVHAAASLFFDKKK